MIAASRIDRWSRLGWAAVLGLCCGCQHSVCERCPPCEGGSCPQPTQRVSESSPTDTVVRPQAPQPSSPAPIVPLDAPVVTSHAMQQVHAIDPSTLERAATQVRVVAQIGTDVVITDDEIWQLVRQDAGAYVRLTGAAREQKEKELFRTALRRVIERELIISEFLGKLRKNKPELIDKVFEDASQSAARQMREFRKRNKVESEEDMARGMRAQGLSYKALLRQLERSAIENMYLSSIIKEEKKKILLSDVERYYQDHPDEFRVEDKVSWNDLFVAYSQFPTEADARRYAEGLLAKLKAGEDFGELAMNYSHGMTKLNKGDGVGEKRGEINPPELEPVVFSLPINQLSDLIPSATGIHIVKVTERIHAGVKPFDERVQTEIKAKLLQQIQEAERAKLIEDLWRKTTVKIAELP